MQLSYIRTSFNAFSGKVSDLGRQLGLAGIAIIWIFKLDYSKTKHYLPPELYLPLTLFCFGLLVDLIQYIYASVAWGIVLRRCKKTKDDDEIKVEAWINTPTWTFFVLKIILFLSAYYFLLFFLIDKI